MAEQSYRPPFTEAFRIRKALAADGWGTPDTYGHEYAEVFNGPAVYLFLVYDRDSEHRAALVGYVGMSITLRQRLVGHPILREIRRTEFWAQRWFKPEVPNRLPSKERELITSFDPPWNVIGRPRGMGSIKNG